MSLNAETIGKLLSAARDDHELAEMIENALTVFENYHRAVYALEVKRKLYACGAMDADEYRDLIPKMDKTRTMTHNAVLTQVNILNRMAAAQSLPPVYEGVVSEEKPYRRQAADAVLEYVRQIILERC